MHRGLRVTYRYRVAGHCRYAIVTRHMAELCYDSAPGGASLFPEHMHRAQRPEHPTTFRVLGHKGLCLHAEAAAETRS